MFPFVSMNIIWKYRDFIGSKAWEDRWGTFTEDSETRYLM